MRWYEAVLDQMEEAAKLREGLGTWNEHGILDMLAAQIKGHLTSLRDIDSIPIEARSDVKRRLKGVISYGIHWPEDVKRLEAPLLLALSEAPESTEKAERDLLTRYRDWMGYRGIEDHPTRALLRIIHNVMGRTGFGELWESVAPDTQREILETNLATLKKELGIA